MSHRVLASVMIGLAIVGPRSPVGGAAELLLVALVIFGIVRVPRFGWGLLEGAAAGAVAGFAILGPGFRLAMRAVAMVDPIRRTEFTVGGTVFIVIGVGLIFGSIFGAYAISVGRLLGLWGAKLAAVTMVGVLLFLFTDPELRSELTDLGLGVWMNLPMFSIVVFAYGRATIGIVDRIERRRVTHRSSEPVRVS